MTVEEVANGDTKFEGINELYSKRHWKVIVFKLMTILI